MPSESIASAAVGDVTDGEHTRVDTALDLVADHRVGGPPDLGDHPVVLVGEGVQFVLGDTAHRVVLGVDAHEPVDDRADPVDGCPGASAAAVIVSRTNRCPIRLASNSTSSLEGKCT